ncbi:protein tyrosine phosphatase [Burkholderia sp. lig30]|uniref:arsenate reductase/protein-tyrosine-phosphatase family protein n=1 Tax=Burkholderia sp. lig30 TaxID=1192124 RepID=UPI000461691C|nr:protein-tyrosine-phosphatase [Burkholderia sp. lig30]KDB09657.1 protein tyrosine phosphatase [Burkholderia sp. lig30]
MTRKYRVLFLCRENSARSIIAEALLRELAGHRFDAFSAGAEPAACVHSLALTQLRPGISALDLLSPKSWFEFTSEWAPQMDLVIAMDGCVEEYPAPVFPGRPAIVRWNFADPLAEHMNQVMRARSFESVFWQILQRVTRFIEVPWYEAVLEPATAARPCSYEN